MQTRATAFGDLYPQTFSGALLLRIKKSTELPRRVLGDGNHRPVNYDLTLLKSKRRARVSSGNQTSNIEHQILP
jgi:hypothetical protein